MKNTVRLNFEFPREEYPYLKMLCAEKGLSLKEFATHLIIKAIEEYEDHRLSRKAHKRLKEMDTKENIPFEKACDLAGWDDEGKV
jgi:predicted DNA-binding protein